MSDLNGTGTGEGSSESTQELFPYLTLIDPKVLGHAARHYRRLWEFHDRYPALVNPGTFDDARAVWAYALKQARVKVAAIDALNAAVSDRADAARAAGAAMSIQIFGPKEDNS